MPDIVVMLRGDRAEIETFLTSQAQAPDLDCERDLQTTGVILTIVGRVDPSDPTR